MRREAQVGLRVIGILEDGEGNPMVEGVGQELADDAPGLVIGVSRTRPVRHAASVPHRPCTGWRSQASSTAITRSGACQHSQ